MQIAPPTRSDVRNTRRSAAAWKPPPPYQRPLRRVRLDADPLSEQELQSTGAGGFLRGSKVGLVTPFRDGMNLVAKEYVAAQDPATRVSWC